MLDHVRPEIYLPIAILSTAAALVYYLLQSYGLYRMLPACGLGRTWMAWVPFARDYKLGAIADLSAFRLDGKRRYHRVIQPIVTLFSALAARVVALVVLGLVAIFFAFLIAVLAGGDNADSHFFNTVFSMIALLFILGGVILVATYVLRLCAYHRIYRLYAPQTAGLFTLLSAIFTPAAPILFVVLSRKEPNYPH